MQRWLCWAVIALFGCCGLARAQSAVDWHEFKLEYSESDLLLSAVLDFDTPKTLEDAANKGVALYFVTQADVYRERWYFYDKRIAHVERHIRISYLPLSRRWRVNVSPEPFASGTLGVNVGQTYDSFDDAMQSVKRYVQWPLAPLSLIDTDSKIYLNFKFRFDLGQLPRPLQIGAASQNDWIIEFEKKVRLALSPAH